jgi:hypothetical protein
MSIVDTMTWRDYRIHAPSSQRIDAPRLSSFVSPETAARGTQYWRASEFPSRVNEGLALLRKHRDRGGGIFVYGETDLFSLALETPPPRHQPLWWDRYFSYNFKIFPAPEAVFSEVGRIMIPRLTEQDLGCCREPAEDFPVLYGDYVTAHYEEVDRTEHWLLLVRRAPL